MRDEDVAKLLERLVRLEIAIQSINPDPARPFRTTVTDWLLSNGRRIHS